MKTVPFSALLLFALAFNADASLVQLEYGILFTSNFDNGVAEGWHLPATWYVQEVDGQYALHATTQHFAVPAVNSSLWSEDYETSFRFRLEQGIISFGFRYDSSRGSYYLGLRRNGRGNVVKEIGNNVSNLAAWTGPPLTGWHLVKVNVSGNEIKVYLDNELKASCTDNTNPLRAGAISIDALQEDQSPPNVYFDDIEVKGYRFTQKTSWEKLGGPSGGLGYDIRIHPQDKRTMFVTDNPTGVQKSTDGGNTWKASNRGVTVRNGASDDGIPTFSLTIDPNNNNIIWSGTQAAKGIFKSMDGGETWLKRDNGVVEGDEISFRGFAVKPGDSNTVLAAAEITTGVISNNNCSTFDRAKGKIYRTTDGGETWHLVWQGDSLARVIIFNPQSPDIVYCSTGIFDRDAWNNAGIGILKSTDSGLTWSQINSGMDNLFTGFLEMHPTNPEILYAAEGMIGRCDFGMGGIYKTVDGGTSWQKILSGDDFTVVVISRSSPNVVYAGSGSAFYRSEDEGLTWKKLYKPVVLGWGPPGIRAGNPISAVVDPDDPMTIFANNYGGGAFKSTDGAVTWVDSSRGYTGAMIWQLAPTRTGYIYTAGSSGVFRSNDGGINWDGLSYSLDAAVQWASIATNPENSLEILTGDQQQGFIRKSTDGGMTWREVFRHPLAWADDPSRRHGFRVICYAPSNPGIVYAGMSKERSRTEGPFPITQSYGMYKSTDSGETWSSVNSGLESTNGNILAIAVHPDDANVVYIGTYQDGVFKSTDGGNSWHPASNGLGSMQIRSLAVDPGNPDVILAGLGEGGGIYRSENSGQLWTGSNDGLIPECPSSLLRAGEVRVGSSNSQINVLSQDSYGIPWSKTTSIAFDPNRSGWVFASDERLGIYMSEDDGLSWTPINEGLSMRAVSDIKLSHNGNYVFAASEGEGVFRLKLSISSLNLALGNGGAAVAGTTGGDGTTQVGYSTLAVNSGTPPYGTAVFSFKQNGVTIAEAGVPASPPTTSARIFIDYRTAVNAIPGRSDAGLIDVNTGIAVINYSSATANVTYTLRDLNGITLTDGHGTLAAGKHFAEFIDQFKSIAAGFNLPSNFSTTTKFGSLEIASDKPLSVLALRGTTNQRHEFLITTTPVADLAQAARYGPVYFPDFADGGGYVTSFLLLNSSNGTETGTLEFLDRNGNRLAVNQVGGTNNSIFGYSIPAGGAFRFQTDGSPAEVKTGWVRLTPDSSTATPVSSGVFSYNPSNALIGESGIPSAVATTHARIYVDLSGSHNTGLAIANVGPTAASVMINAYQIDGRTGIGTNPEPLQLAGNGQDAKFVDQFISDLPEGFTGVLDIGSATPFAALTLRSLMNERKEFMMTTFPIADMNCAAPSPIVFPQIVDGGGYVTQFILIGAGGASSVTLNFYGDDGKPLAVGR
jgi:photosystem II stability/assembly factor-like uncharacterized protein